VVLEAHDPLGERGERVEVLRRERLALEDREVDLDLVEPGGVVGQVDQTQVLPLRALLRFHRSGSGAGADR
jgi:hypothetical protein